MVDICNAAFTKIMKFLFRYSFPHPFSLDKSILKSKCSSYQGNFTYRKNKYWDRLVYLTLLHSERPKLYTILAFLSAIG